MIFSVHGPSHNVVKIHRGIFTLDARLKKPALSSSTISLPFGLMSEPLNREKLEGQIRKIVRNYIRHMLHVWYIYLHEWLTFMMNVGLNVLYMEHLGTVQHHTSKKTKTIKHI